MVALPRILPQVSHSWDVRRIFLASEEVALDGFETDLPGVVPERHQIGIVTEVEELTVRPFGDFTLEEGREIVAIEGVLTLLIQFPGLYFDSHGRNWWDRISF